MQILKTGLLPPKGFLRLSSGAKGEKSAHVGPSLLNEILCFTLDALFLQRGGITSQLYILATWIVADRNALVVE